MSRGLVTCEQVSSGHPDKLADRISDYILTRILEEDSSARVAVETMVKSGKIILAGEVTTRADIESNQYTTWTKEALQTIDQSYYDSAQPHGFSMYTNYITSQSPDISQGVDIGGAGDQGMMVGYATNECSQCLPLPYIVATEILQQLEKMRQASRRTHGALQPDAKAQVTYNYDKQEFDTILVSTQHYPGKFEAAHDLTHMVVASVMGKYSFQNMDEVRFLFNPTGKFETGGAVADTGLTGRKIIADTYGGVARHGGGAFSGKDPTKVDRSGAYKARQVAKRLVTKGYASRLEVHVAYAIGIPEPVSLGIETFGTAKATEAEILELVKREDFRPRAIIEELDLLKVDYVDTCSYGHFTKRELPWEKI